MATYTQGPWYATGSSPDGTVHAETGECIVPHHPGGSTENTMADAHLISAAPDLLLELEDLVQGIEAGISTAAMLATAMRQQGNSYLERAHRAIDKAYGRKRR